MDASASNDAGHVQEFDFWEFVTCAKCYQPFSSDGLSGPVIPFWLTECGHIVCNHHLSAYLWCCLWIASKNKCSVSILICLYVVELKVLIGAVLSVILRV